MNIVSNLFFFSSRRRHTRCGRDWSSDVRSSDLARTRINLAFNPPDGASGQPLRYDIRYNTTPDWGSATSAAQGDCADFSAPLRSEERRVGKECSSRWCAD